MLLLKLLPEIINATSLYLNAIFSSTLYIGPARARSDRYYRYQDLSVSEIDPDGKNLPMFLYSLSPEQFGGLSDWVHKLFGFRIKLTPSSGHLSVMLIGEDGAEVNIVDTGFGVSQVLPVLAQIWWANNRTEASVSPNARSRADDLPTIIAIEQPELHLHPAHQAILADALTQSVELGRIAAAHSSHENVTHFLVETHSDAIINRLGALVADGHLKPDDVSVILFGRGGNEQTVSARVSSFSAEGELVDWPYGFFSSGTAVTI